MDEQISMLNMLYQESLQPCLMDQTSNLRDTYNIS